MAHAYLPIFEIEPLDVGQIYERLPLHCTLVNWFTVDAEPTKVEELMRQALEGVSSFTLRAGELKMFGRNFDIPVHVIEPADEARRIHNLVMDKLAALAINFAAPDFVGEGCNAHVTAIDARSFSTGSEQVCRNVYLIESTSPDYAGAGRIVRAKVPLA